MIAISAQTCIVGAIRYIPVAVVTLITSCTPLLVFPMRYFLLGNEEGTNSKTAAVGASALAGITMIFVVRIWKGSRRLRS